MSIIRTYTDLDTELELPQTVKNFPSLKAMFQINEAVGAAGITEKLSGAVASATAINAGADAYSKDVRVSLNTSIATTFPLFTGVVTALFGVFDDGAAQKLIIGNAAGSNPSLSIDGIAYRDLGGYMGAFPWTYNNVAVSRAIAINALDGNCYGWEYNGTTFNAIGPVGPYAGTFTFGTPDPAIGHPNVSADDAYGYSLHQFAALPTDDLMEHVLIWNWDNWHAGKKVLYPGLVGVS